MVAVRCSAQSPTSHRAAHIAQVGVVSDFDMLTLDAISGKARYEQSGFFPDTHTDWSTFFELQKLLTKNQGKT